jgi:hypothetical protein
MLFKKPLATELNNESDVEQKLIYPLLIAERPYGLGLSTSLIQTKKNLRRFEIDKGDKKKSYFPDYLVVVGGLPLMVVEAKGPKSDLPDAFREARLYAHELNAAYPHNINPVSRVIASDGANLWAGPTDSSDPKLKIKLDDIDIYSNLFAELCDFVGAEAIAREFSRLSKLLRPAKFFKPRRKLGGLAVQHEEVGHNTFGATISAELGHIFNPQSSEDRARVAKDAYVPSNRRDRYVDPIDKVVRAAMPNAELKAKLIEDTASPSEIVKVLKRGKQLEHQVLLIVGNVGAGKTTFIDRLKLVSLPPEVRDRTLWVHFNMNVAPVSPTEIYNWLRLQIIEGCRAASPEWDFDDLDVWMKLYAVEVNKFNKTIGKLLKNSRGEYNIKLASMLEELDRDISRRAMCHARFCANERGKLLVIVLDNCDKRTRDEQLLMFEAAQWLQKEFKGLVVLPLREETYDNHRDQPPLDTALKDLVFRIEAPLFHQVLVRRLQLAFDELSQGKTSHRFSLPNGFHVDYDASDQAFFLTAIASAVFHYDRQIRRLIIGLAGKNMRRALEIFLEFCNSGYIGEDLILKIIQREGNFLIPLEVVVTVLVRMNRRFYDGDYSYVKNVLAANAEDSRLNYFCRLIILNWLRQRWGEVGPTGLKGFFRVEELCADLSLFGVEEHSARREIEYLAAAQCIVSEDFRVDQLGNDDLIRLAPAGFVHLELINNVYYLAAVAEDTWFSDPGMAEAIASRIRTVKDQSTITNVIQNAEDLLRYLTQEQSKGEAVETSIVDQRRYKGLTNLEESARSLEKAKKEYDPTGWLDFKKRYRIGSISTATIVNANVHGIFAEIEPGFTGLVHRSKLPRDYLHRDELSIGEKVRVRVKWISWENQRLSLELLRDAVLPPA